MTSTKHIFVWKAFKEWGPVLEDMFADILNPELKTKLQDNAAKIESWNDPGLFEEFAGQSIVDTITTEKIDSFRQRYSHIRLYHACRPENVSSYYEKGLLLRNNDELFECFRSIFLNGSFPELTEEMLQHSIKESTEYLKNEWKLCYFVDDRITTVHSSHYLIYGSESIGVLVTNLPIENVKKEQYKSVLRNIGNPTIFEIDLPNTPEFVDCNLIAELTDYMIRNWTYNVAHSSTKTNFYEDGFAFTMPLPPEYIRSHYHPRKIADHHMKR